ncbi:hypothetical protein N7537_006848 [Penicillium hordei]|uniref:Uncharacterized protein n=1 Tax=Penicillium hordei TaxID=40994 RepID=A0AAD6E9I4_9EURO|nr:uncharacterized protein N7537_006848 [Penicillium hordei]KAJ5603892.1 hypothetical protein N7537_006848 [Penicillium hordei]
MQAKVMPQIVEDSSGPVVNDLSAIPIGQARLLLYLDLQDVLSTQPASETLTLLAMILGTDCQPFTDVVSVQYTASILKISPHPVSSPIIGRRPLKKGWGNVQTRGPQTPERGICGQFRVKMVSQPSITPAI